MCSVGLVLANRAVACLVHISNGYMLNPHLIYSGFVVSYPTPMNKLFACSGATARTHSFYEYLFVWFNLNMKIIERIRVWVCLVPADFPQTFSIVNKKSSVTNELAVGTDHFIYVHMNERSIIIGYPIRWAKQNAHSVVVSQIDDCLYTRRWCNANDIFSSGAFIYTETTYCSNASNTCYYIIESLFLCRRLRFGIWFLFFRSSSQKYLVFVVVGKLIWADAVVRPDTYEYETRNPLRCRSINVSVWCEFSRFDVWISVVYRSRRWVHVQNSYRRSLVFAAAKPRCAHKHLNASFFLSPSPPNTVSFYFRKRRIFEVPERTIASSHDEWRELAERRALN